MIEALFIASAGAAPSLHLSPWLGVFLAAVLVFLNGFFVAAEFALVKVRPTQIEPHLGQLSGRLARSMVENLDSYLAACQLGITLASLGLGWIGEPAFAWIMQDVLGLLPNASPALTHSLSLIAAFVLITVLHIVLGEMAPKSLAIRRPRRTSLWISLPLYLFYYGTYPIIWALNGLAILMLRLVGIEPASEGQLAASEEEIRRILASAHESRLPEDKRELLDNIFELSHRVARQVMVPRADVVYLDLERPMEENLELARKTGHTRFPLCQGDLDHVVGLVHIKDLFRARELPTSLEHVRREIIFVPETQPLELLLRRMRQDRLHMAALLDEYGGVSGIVTLENVIEEIVGEIQDEFDFERPEIVKVGENQYRVLGSMLVEDLEDELDVNLGESRAEDTMAGVALSEIGRRARPGDRIEVGPLLVEVLEVERNRIRALKVTVPQVEDEPLAEAARPSESASSG